MIKRFLSRKKIAHSLLSLHTWFNRSVLQDQKYALCRLGSDWAEIQAACIEQAKRFKLPPLIHPQDTTFDFCISRGAFSSLDDAVGFYYLQGHNSALKLQSLVSEFLSPEEDEIVTLFDFGAEFGSVARHYESCLPGARVTACDSNPVAVDFLKNTLGINAVPGATESGAFPATFTYDAVFVLDFFSHLPKDLWQPWLDVLFSMVRKGGVLIFTTHGKDSLSRYGNPTLGADGFIFEPLQKMNELEPLNYGYSLSSKSFVDEQLASLSDAETLAWREGEWWGYQDVYVVQKGGVEQATAHGDPRSLNSKSWYDYQAICLHEAALKGTSGCIHPKDHIFNFCVEHKSFDINSEAIAYYFSQGRESAELLFSLIAESSSLADAPFSLLEFASGYGGVTRHMKNVMPHVEVTACDIHPAAMDFVKNELHENVVLSDSVPENVDLAQSYDVIFALSFFSHMPDHSWGRWLQTLWDGVAVGGLLIFTTHGKVSMEQMPPLEVDSNGFWFEDTSEQKDLETSEYGMTVTLYPYVSKHIEALGNAKIMAFKEGFWWEHQDVYVVQKMA